MTRQKPQIGDRRNNETRRRVEEGGERKRAAVLQDTMSIAIADFGFFAQGELDGGRKGEKFKAAPLGNPSF